MRHWRLILYGAAVALGAAQFWIFSWFLDLEVNTQRTVGLSLSLLALVAGSWLMAFWATADQPSRIRFRGMMRAAMAIFAGVGILCSQAGLNGWMWVWLALAVIAWGFSNIPSSWIFGSDGRPVQRSSDR